MFNRHGLLLVIFVGISGGIAVVALSLRDRLPRQPAAPALSRSVETADEPNVRRLCSHCHRFPEPDSLPRSAWQAVVSDMVVLPGYGSNSPQRTDPNAIVAWYESQAPEQFDFPALPGVSDPGRFQAEQKSAAPRDADAEPVVAHVMFTDLFDDPGLELVVCEMRLGRVLVGRPATGRFELDVIAEIAHPAHAEAVDLDGDGRRDLVVADLGSYLPLDHNLGRVEWLRQTESGEFERRTLFEGLGRIADVQPADFDGDGDLDLIVSEFGWRTTGHVLILENVSSDPAEPEFAAQYVDSRSGTIHATATDLDADGRLDLVALLAQEHEAVVAYLHRGEYRFDLREIYRAPHPSWGSSGMQLVDLDQDEDLDVLVTNGDMLDDGRIKPYHGIQWLENTGELRFETHRLALMYGAHRAEAADLDGDGDLDIIACAFTAWGSGETPSGRTDTLDRVALMWLEQTAPGVFRPWNLEVGPGRHPTLAAADFDLDGDVDVAVGNATPVGSPISSWVEIWENTRTP